MNNSVFGKTMENIRKRVVVRLVAAQMKLSKLVSKPAYVNSKIFEEDVAAVYKMEETLTLDRPAYLGMCILDLSKTLVYEFHYKYAKEKYGSRTKLFFTDTNSLTYETQVKDVYKDFWEDGERYKKVCDQKNIAHQDYRYSPNNKQIYHAMKTIRSVCHRFG